MAGIGRMLLASVQVCYFVFFFSNKPKNTIQENKT